MNFNIKKRSKITEEDLNFIIDNYSTMKNKDIAKAINIHSLYVKKLINEYNLPVKHKDQFLYSKKNANLEKIKSMNDPKIIYILGYLWADGHLGKTKITDKKIYSHIRLGIMKKDFLEIQEAIKLMGNGKVYFNENVKTNFTDNGQPLATWLLSDIELAAYLESLDFHIKSYVCPEKLLALIPDKLKHYFWLGFFDGDGCLFIEKNKTVPHSIQFSAHKDFNWIPLIEELSKINIESKSIRYSCNGLFDSRLMISKRYFQMKFLRYIYQNKENDNLGLNRKYQKYLIVKDYNPEEPKLKIEEKNIHFKQQCQKYVVAFSKNGKRIVQKLFDKYEDAINFKYKYLNSIQNKV